jgi:hypothetical protein
MAFLAYQVKQLSALTEVTHDVIVVYILVKFVYFQYIYVVLLEFE